VSVNNKYKFICFKQENGIASITLNRPEKLNAICFAMVEELHDAVSSIDITKIKALFITGNSDAFSAGGDLKEMKQLTKEEAERRSLFIQNTFRKIQKLEIPSVAFIRGFCFGGGLELALHCDIRIADNNVRFAFPEVKYGIIPGAGGTVIFSAIAGQSQAAYYLLTGEEFDQNRAAEINVVHKIVDAGSFENEVLNQKKFFTETDIRALKTIKHINKLKTDKNTDNLYKEEARLFAELLHKNGKTGISDKFK
jgi:enoyl-CoA hydratase/carnithine racemase